MKIMEKLTPMMVVHNFCRSCVGSTRDAVVAECGGHNVFATNGECPFYGSRNGDRRIKIKAFRKFCLECQGGSYTAIDECQTDDCLIYPYRYGKNPSRQGIGNPASLPLSCRIKKN